MPSEVTLERTALPVPEGVATLWVLNALLFDLLVKRR
jgi:hypothetical protein